MHACTYVNSHLAGKSVAGWPTHFSSLLLLIVIHTVEQQFSVPNIGLRHVGIFLLERFPSSEALLFIVTLSPIHRGMGYCFRSISLYLCFFVSKITRTTGPICMKFSGKVWKWPWYDLIQFWVKLVKPCDDVMLKLIVVLGPSCAAI